MAENLDDTESLQVEGAEESFGFEDFQDEIRELILSKGEISVLFLMSRCIPLLFYVYETLMFKTKNFLKHMRLTV